MIFTLLTVEDDEISVIALGGAQPSGVIINVRRFPEPGSIMGSVSNDGAKTVASSRAKIGSRSAGSYNWRMHKQQAYRLMLFHTRNLFDDSRISGNNRCRGEQVVKSAHRGKTCLQVALPPRPI
jgi:hypothetical protein